jgi:hypothetical protein
VELRETLCSALNGISGRLCDAFVLRNVADLSIRETAATLGLSVAGVKSRLLRARGRLRQRLRKASARGGAYSRTGSVSRTTLLGPSAARLASAGQAKLDKRVRAHSPEPIPMIATDALGQFVRRAPEMGRVSA